MSKQPASDPTRHLRPGEYAAYGDTLDAATIKCPRYDNNRWAKEYYYQMNEAGLPVVQPFRFEGYPAGSIVFEGPELELEEQVHGRWVEALTRPDYTVSTKAELSRWIKAVIDCPWDHKSHGWAGRGYYPDAIRWMETEFRAAVFQYEGRLIEVFKRREILHPNAIIYSYTTGEQSLYFRIDGRRLPYLCPEHADFRPQYPETYKCVRKSLLRVLNGLEEAWVQEEKNKKSRRQSCISTLQSLCNLRVTLYEQSCIPPVSAAKDQEEQSVMHMIELHAGELGWSVEWPGLYPHFTDKEGYTPSFNFLSRKESA